MCISAQTGALQVAILTLNLKAGITLRVPFANTSEACIQPACTSPQALAGDLNPTVTPLNSFSARPKFQLRSIFRF
jgi:hypothetical protein